MCRGLFITGTGTDVGKTYVSGLILKALRDSGRSAAYYKAAMSGNDRRPDGSLIPGDARYVQQVSGISQPLEEMCPYVYEAPLSPHLAARLEGRPVELEKVLAGFRDLRGKYDDVVMEGSGGILCPIRVDEREKLYLPQVVKACGLGCLLVADAGLGTINHTALTAFYLKEQGIPLKGIIFNRYAPGNVMQEDNVRICEALTGVKVVARVREGDRELDMIPEALIALFDDLEEKTI